MSLPPLDMSKRTARIVLVGLWLATCVWLLIINASILMPMNFRDPDDALRLAQVRDLLNGQSWFDLTQYRLLPPQGVPMHWSRIVDLPLATMLFLLTPLIGQFAAERTTLIAVPLLELLALFALIYAICRAVALHRGTALIAVALLATSVTVLVQFAPMRIDHHGTQILFGGLAVLALLHPERRHGLMGLLAGFAMAAWLQVSLEGMPMAVAIGAVFGLRAVWNRDWQKDLPAYLLGLTGLSALLLFGMHYPSAAMVFWCDAMSPSFLLPLAATTLTLIVTQRIVPTSSWLTRAIPLGLAGAAGAMTFLSLAHQCLAGPFDTLDPIVYKLWYQAVMEGLPFYVQQPDMWPVLILPGLIGLPGALIAWRRAKTDQGRIAWLSLIFIQLASFALSLNVMRAMCFAHFIAVPGIAVLVVTLMKRAQQLRLMPLRVLLTASAAIISPFGVAIVTTAAFEPQNASEIETDAKVDRLVCTSWAKMRGLDALPAATLFTPLDIGAHVLVYTHHSVVATGHHRNVAGMKAVLEGLIAKPDQARPIVAATGAHYLAFCKGENEVKRYKKHYPHSLIAALMAGKAPDWLQKVPMRRGETIQVYRIIPPTH
jgi:hypothetical protein